MIGLVVLLLSGCGSSGSGDGLASKAEVALRRQAPDGRLALLEIDPFQVGLNTFHVRIMDQKETPVAAASVELRLSTPEDNSGVADVPTTIDAGGTVFTAEHELQ